MCLLHVISKYKKDVPEREGVGLRVKRYQQCRYICTRYGWQYVYMHHVALLTN